MRSGRLSRLVSVALLALLSTAALAANASFSPQVRVGFTVADQWEPTIAADGYGHVYILYPQYGLVPGCAACPIPTMVLVKSNDNGVTWQPAHEIVAPSSGQYDPQIVVDPADHRTVFAAWVQSNKRDVVVAKSADFGQSWSVALAARSEDSDKPVLAVRGQDVYVAFNHDGIVWVASSHDGGITFLSSIASALRFDWALPGGGTIDPSGSVYFSWAGYVRGGNGRVNLYVSKSADAGKSWTSNLMDTAGSPPQCAAYHCGWSYLGAQIAIASDSAGTIYAVWNSSKVDRSPERIYFASSTTAGATWSPKAAVSLARSDVEHGFPAIAAGAAGDVRIAWMDSRNNPDWNTYYRSSTNGGASWSPESRLSTETPGYSYIHHDGFAFPFGDYFGVAIDNRGQSHAVWGEGLNFQSPGSIWYSTGR